MDGLAKGRPGADQLGIGETLRRAREQRGLTLSQAAEATRIRSTHLLSLEEEDFAALPAPVFARGLLRTYARHLGLKEDELVALLDNHQLLVDTARVQPEVPRLRSSGSAMPRFLATCLVVILLGTLGYYLYHQYATFVASERGVPAGLPTPAPAVAAALPTPQPTAILALTQPRPTSAPAVPTPPTPAPTPAPTATALPTPTATPLSTVTVEAIFTGTCWVQVWVDDVEVIHNWTAKAGERRVWTGKKVYLWVGNAGAVDIIYNGKPLGRLGAQGEAVKTTWTAS